MRFNLTAMKQAKFALSVFFTGRTLLQSLNQHLALRCNNHVIIKLFFPGYLLTATHCDGSKCNGYQ